MTTSPKKSLISAVLDNERLEPYHLGYFQARMRNRIHDLVLSSFLEAAEQKGVTKADIARRLGKKPEQITRWLAAPGNWTFNTASNLLLALGQELNFEIVDLS